MHVLNGSAMGKSNAHGIKKAIVNANLGFSPMDNGES